MKGNINFLFKGGSLESKKKRLTGIRLISVSFLILLALFSIVIFFINSSLNSDLFKKDENFALSSLELQRKKEAKLLMSRDRLNTISKILKDRVDYYRVVDSILTKVPKEIIVERMEINKKTIALTVSSNSLSRLGDFIDNLITIVGEKELMKNLVLESLTLNEKTGNYVVFITSSLK